MPSDCLKVPEKNGHFAIGSPGGVAAGGLAGFRRGGGRGWGKEVGKSLVAHLGVGLMGWRWHGRARRGSPAALGSGHRGGGKNSGEPGRVRAMHGRGGVHGVLGRGEDGWTAMEGQGGRARRAALMAAGGGVKQWAGRSRCVEGGAASGLSL
jgi:hypothetical protein